MKTRASAPSVPYVKRIEDKISVSDVTEVLRFASQKISEALGAAPKPDQPRRLRKKTT